MEDERKHSLDSLPERLEQAQTTALASFALAWSTLVPLADLLPISMVSTGRLAVVFGFFSTIALSVLSFVCLLDARSLATTLRRLGVHERTIAIRMTRAHLAHFPVLSAITYGVTSFLVIFGLNKADPTVPWYLETFVLFFEVLSLGMVLSLHRSFQGGAREFAQGARAEFDRLMQLEQNSEGTDQPAGMDVAE